MEGTKIIETEKEGNQYFSAITLRPFKLSDTAAFMVWASDDQVTRYCRWDSYTDEKDGLKHIENFMIPHPWCRAICIDNMPVGAISVSENTGEDKCRGELGYVLAFKYWGKGIATKAVKMVLDTIFKEWPHLERLEALVDVENIGSQRVLEKAGFYREGVLRKFCILKGRTRDMVVFSVLSTDIPT